MIQCPKCGKNIPDGNEYCGHCGSKLVQCGSQPPERKYPPGKEPEEIKGLLKAFLAELHKAFPDRIIDYSKWNHEKWDKPAKYLCKQLEYKGLASMLRAYGFRIKRSSLANDNRKLSAAAEKQVSADQFPTKDVARKPGQMKNSKMKWYAVSGIVAVIVIALCLITLRSCGDKTQGADFVKTAEQMEIQNHVDHPTEGETENHESGIQPPLSGQTGYVAYDEKIAEYLSAATMSKDSFFEIYGGDYSSINSLMIGYFHSYDGTSLCYALYDVDENGVPELIFSDAYNVIDIYTLKDDSIVKLFADCYFGERSRLHILSDGRLLSEGSGGAFSGACEMCRIGSDGATVTTVEAFYHDGNGQDSYLDATHSYISSDAYVDLINTWLADSIFDEMLWTVIASNE